MTETQQAILLAKLDELRDALPVRGTRPEDAEAFRLLHEVKQLVTKDGGWLCRP